MPQVTCSTEVTCRPRSRAQTEGEHEKADKRLTDASAGSSGGASASASPGARNGVGELEAGPGRATMELEALDRALRSGLLTEHEYDEKKAQLLSRSGP